MKYIIVVNSGGTKTEATAYDLAGGVLARHNTGFGNLLTDKKVALNNLKEAIDQLVNQLQEGACQRIIMGIAGIDSGGFKEDILGEFQQWQGKLSLMNDAWLSYYALLKESDGCLVIAGTGSVCIGKIGEKKYRVGGWGHLLGDEGSAYWLASEALKQLLHQEDLDEEFSLLSLLLLSELKQTSVAGIVKYVYQHTKNEIAALALVVAKAADLGDSQAILLLKKAGQELAKQVAMLLKQMAILEPVTIGVSGSVLTRNKLVYQQFVSELQKRGQSIRVIQETEALTMGGYYFYQKYFTEEKGV